MRDADRLKIPVIVLLITLSGCMEAGDYGKGPACASGLASAESALMSAKADSVGTTFDWAKAAALIFAARTQQQFNEYENCLIKARNARRIVSRHY
jgi:hypothetical protein